VTNFESLAGRGVKAQVGDTTYYIGGPRLLEQQGWDVPEALRSTQQKAESAGQSVIYLATKTGIVALFAIADVIREESYAGGAQAARSGRERSPCSPETAKPWRKPLPKN
jgi:P-type Cu2+ transporter